MPLWHLTVTEGANPILLLWQPRALGRADCHERRRPLVAFTTEVKAEEVRQKLLAMQKECLIELGGAVIAVKGAKGNIKLNQLINTTAAGAVTAVFWGTLIGLISKMRERSTASAARSNLIGASSSPLWSLLSARYA